MTSRLAQAAVRAAATVMNNQNRRTLFMAALTACLIIGFHSPARAANISASSDGYGLFASLDALVVVNLDVGPLPLGVSGATPAAYSDSGTVLNVNVSSSVPLVASATATAGAVTGAAASDVDGGFGSRTTSASGGIVDGGVGVFTLPVIGNGLALLEIGDATLNATAQIAGDFGSLSASGSTTIESLTLTINSIPVDLSAYLNVAVAPNTGIDLSALGIANASLLLNEQIVAGDQSSIEVNAFHLNVNIAGTIVAEVILGHSQAQMTAVPEPASVGLGTLTLGAFGLIRRIASSRRRLI